MQANTQTLIAVLQLSPSRLASEIARAERCPTTTVLPLGGSGVDQVRALDAHLPRGGLLHAVALHAAHWLPFVARLRGVRAIIATPLSRRAGSLSDLADEVLLIDPRHALGVSRPDVARVVPRSHAVFGVPSGTLSAESSSATLTDADLPAEEWPALARVVAAVIDGDADAAKAAFALTQGHTAGLAAFLLARSMPMSPGERIALAWASRRNLGPRALVLHDLGIAYARGGCTKDAATALEEAIERDPALASAWIARIDLEVSRGARTLALEWLQRFAIGCPGALAAGQVQALATRLGLPLEIAVHRAG